MLIGSGAPIRSLCTPRSTGPAEWSALVVRMVMRMVRVGARACRRASFQLRRRNRHGALLA